MCPEVLLPGCPSEVTIWIPAKKFELFASLLMSNSVSVKIGFKPEGFVTKSTRMRPFMIFPVLTRNMSVIMNRATKD